MYNNDYFTQDVLCPYLYLKRKTVLFIYYIVPNAHTHTHYHAAQSTYALKDGMETNHK